MSRISPKRVEEGFDDRKSDSQDREASLLGGTDSPVAGERITAACIQPSSSD